MTASRYRADVDGLRAIAISAVVAYHGFPTWIHGGFVGVDIFFVISGYLITGVIFSHLLNDDFSITDFYQRRVLRIFPSLLVVTFSVFLAGWFLLAPRDFDSLGSNIAGGALFVQNWVLLGQVGYFDIEANKKPLLHLWSLGIEEQYYIAWPLLLLLFRRKRWNVMILTIALIAASFCIGLTALKKNADLAFYLPFTRAWELLVGSAISIFFNTKNDNEATRWIDKWFQFFVNRAEDRLQTLAKSSGAGKPYKRVQEIFAVIALAAVTFAVLRYKPYTPYPGWASVISVFGTSVLILTPNALINRFILASRLMVFIGLISYPLYLWHFPLMAFAHILTGDAVSSGAMVTIIATSFGLAWLTYKFVERPIRYGKRLVRAKTVTLVVGMAGAGILGLIATLTHGFPSRVPETIRELMVTNEEAYAHWRRGRCLMLPEQGAADFDEECSGKNGPRPLLFTWGDSYGAALYPGFEYFSASRHFSVSEYTASACPPLIGYVYSERPFCKPINDFVLTKIAEEQPDVVILHSTWITLSQNEDALVEGLKTTVSKLRALNIKKIVLLGPPATWLGDGLVANVLDYYYQHGYQVLPERTKYRSNDAWTRATDAWLKKHADELGITYISLRNLMCNDDGCLARIGQNGADVTAFDWGHLTKAGAIFVVGSILDQLLDNASKAGPQ